MVQVGGVSGTVPILDGILRIEIFGSSGPPSDVGPRSTIETAIPGESVVTRSLNNPDDSGPLEVWEPNNTRAVGRATIVRVRKDWGCTETLSRDDHVA